MRAHKWSGHYLQNTNALSDTCKHFTVVPIIKLALYAKTLTHFRAKVATKYGCYIVPKHAMLAVNI